MHGYAIAQTIHLLSDEVLKVEEGSLYPALWRLDSTRHHGEIRPVGEQPEGEVLPNHQARAKAGGGTGSTWSRLSAAVARVLGGNQRCADSF